MGDDFVERVDYGIAWIEVLQRRVKFEPLDPELLYEAARLKSPELALMGAIDAKGIMTS